MFKELRVCCICYFHTSTQFYWCLVLTYVTTAHNSRWLNTYGKPLILLLAYGNDPNPQVAVGIQMEWGPHQRRLVY